MTASTELDSSANAGTAPAAVNPRLPEMGAGDAAEANESCWRQRRPSINRQSTPDSEVSQAHETTTSEESESEASSDASDCCPGVVSSDSKLLPDNSDPQTTEINGGPHEPLRQEEMTPTASTEAHDGAAKTLGWALSLAYVAFMVYIQLILQAGFTTISYIAAPLAYLYGGSTSWWNTIDTLYEIHERVIILMGLAFKGTKLYFYGDYAQVRAKKESCIVICNHQVEGDYFVMAAAMEKTGKLARLRHVMKGSLIWIPYVGSFLVRRGSFFINRANLDWKSFDNNCRRLREDKVPTCLLIYPEGTTLNNAIKTREVLEKSRQVAIENGLEPFRHVLFPKHRGFYRLLDKLRGEIDAIYDLTLMYSSARDSYGQREPAPYLTELANGYCPEIHIHLRRIDIKDVPEEEKDVRQFLIDRFTIKDRLMDSFYSTGKLAEKGIHLPSQSQRHLIQTSLIVLVGVWLGFTSTGFALLPGYLLLPAIIGLVHVTHHHYLGS